MWYMDKRVTRIIPGLLRKHCGPEVHMVTKLQVRRSYLAERAVLARSSPAAAAEAAMAAASLRSASRSCSIVFSKSDIMLTCRSASCYRNNTITDVKSMEK